MNRKKAILILASLESMLLAMTLTLYFNGAIGLKAFAAAIIAVSLAMAVAIFVVFKKTE